MAGAQEKQISDSSSTEAPSSTGPEESKGQDGRLQEKHPDPRELQRRDSQPGKRKRAEGEDPLAHLPEHERKIIQRQLEIPPVKVTYLSLFRYATTKDLVWIAISAFCAIAGGAVMPLMTIIFGELTGTFTGFFQGTVDGAQFTEELNQFTLYFVYLGIGEFVTIYIATAGFIYTGEHIAQKIREQYLAAVLRQNIGFFDLLGAGEITTRITADTNLVQDGLSEKIGLTLTALATFITAFIIGFIRSWRLTLILCSTVIAIVLVMGAASKFIVKFNKRSLESYAVGGTIAEEVISSIRNATAFGTQNKLARQYDAHLTEAEKWGFKMKALLGCMLGCMFWIIYLNYGLSFWQGSRFIVWGTDGIDVQDVITILLAVMIGAFSLGNVAPNAQAFTTAVAAANKIFSTIDRKSPLDPTSTAGDKIENLRGTVELQNIRMIYPSRPEVCVMEDVNLVVPAGKTTALVGASGSGKSTIVGLVERFYDPVGGKVFLDDHDIQTLNLRWLRQQISLVSQEPTLFGTTIYGNIKHGLIGTKYESVGVEKQTELIEHAARMANAHDFVTGLPEGYETNVGERGFLLSGGQKQRIAIARAIVSDPKILLLDEATSALDTKSEGVVQDALDKAAEGRTTIVIAHRLSTIKSADKIVVMSKGRIVEQGTHDELIDAKAAYYNLVEAQRIAIINEGKNAEEVALFDEKDSQLYRSPTKEQVNAFEEVNTLSKLSRTQTGMSASSKALKNKPESERRQYTLGQLIKIVAGFNKPEWPFMVLGLIASMIAGAGNPVQAIFFAKSIVAISGGGPGGFANFQNEVNFWSGMYLMLAFVQLIAWTTEGISFGYCSEKLIHRVRDQAFRTMLRQDVAFFDREENTAGALTTFLSTETTHLAGMSGSTLGTILSVLTTLVGACVLSLVIGWKLALVCIATIPILLGCGFFRFWMLARFQTRSKNAYKKSASYACEATAAIRTVASLTRENDVWENYHQQLVAQAQKSLISVLKSSVLYAASQAFMFLCIALGFWYGGQLIGSYEYTPEQFFIVFSAVIFGSQSAGTVFSFAPDMGKAKHATAELQALFDRKPDIDSWSKEGSRLDGVEGHIEFRDVHFRYPTRPEQPVLRGLNLTVKPGQYVALVGPSGCGKSTTIALLERFYDPLVGGIHVDGKEISSLNINDYRSYLALVSQEPTLYQGTVRDNILLGADKEDVAEEAIIQACKDANIYEFILSLP